MIQLLLGRVAELERTVARQRDEIARPKGGKGRPQIKPSGMEKASDGGGDKPGDASARPGANNAELVINEERIMTAASVPRGSLFKGYTTFVMQDLVLRPARDPLSL